MAKKVRYAIVETKEVKLGKVFDRETVAHIGKDRIFFNQFSKSGQRFEEVVLNQEQFRKVVRENKKLGKMM